MLDAGSGAQCVDDCSDSQGGRKCISCISCLASTLKSVKLWCYEMDRHYRALATAQCRHATADSLAADSAPGRSFHVLRKGGG
jgi:hypothetical protein